MIVESSKVVMVLTIIEVLKAEPDQTPSVKMAALLLEWIIADAALARAEEFRVQKEATKA